jgi:hypothetical protein
MMRIRTVQNGVGTHAALLMSVAGQARNRYRRLIRVYEFEEVGGDMHSKNPNKKTGKFPKK